MSSFKFSVVIPTYHREDLLARCLESLRPGEQTIDAALYEVIVSDDARDRTAEEMIRTKFPWARWVHGPGLGPAANRNNGARHATGEWICFIDDDCIASKEWLAAYLNASSDDSIDMMEGRTTIPDRTDTPFQHAVSNHDGGAYWSCNLAVRRKPFLALNGFDEDFREASCEDMEFAHRFHAHQLHANFYPDALVLHPVRPLGMWSLWKRTFMIRWSAMYRYKIDLGLHLSKSPAENIWAAIKDTCLDHLRITWQAIKRWNAPYWRSRWFSIALRWITFPIIFPYYLYWVYRFHGLLDAKQDSVGN